MLPTDDDSSMHQRAAVDKHCRPMLREYFEQKPFKCKMMQKRAKVKKIQKIDDKRDNNCRTVDTIITYIGQSWNGIIALDRVSLTTG